MNFQFTTDELVQATTKICDLGKSMNYEPDQWTIILSMIAKHLADAKGLEVTSVKEQLPN